MNATQKSVPEKAFQPNLFAALSMDSEEHMVFRHIKERIGRDQAISVKDISEKTDIRTREVRDIVKNLIEIHRLCIGSALGQPSGYFMIATLEEAEDNERTLRHLALSILKRAAALKKLSLKEYIDQLELGI